MKVEWERQKSKRGSTWRLLFLETESNKGDPSPHASCAHSLCARNAYPTTQGMWTLSAPTMLTTTLTHSPCPASLTSFFPLIHCILLFLQEFNKNEKKKMVVGPNLILDYFNKIPKLRMIMSKFFHAPPRFI